MMLLHDRMDQYGDGSNLAFYQGLELNFVYGVLTCSSAIRTRDYNLAPLAFLAAVGKIK